MINARIKELKRKIKENSSKYKSLLLRQHFLVLKCVRIKLFSRIFLKYFLNILNHFSKQIFILEFSRMF